MGDLKVGCRVDKPRQREDLLLCGEGVCNPDQKVRRSMDVIGLLTACDPENQWLVHVA